MYRPSVPTRMPSSVLLDDSGPRPLPSYLRQPLPPPPQEKVLPCVPDVSLILGPSLDPTVKIFSELTTAAPGPAPGLFATKPPSAEKHIPVPASQSYASESLLVELITLVKQQSIKIERIESQLQSLIKLQVQKDNNFAEACVQTNIPDFARQKSKENRKPIRDTSSLEVVRPNDQDISLNHSADLSKILKDLQLPITADHSIYSIHNSAPHVDLPEFTEHNNLPLNKSEAESSPGIGPSVSEYGSSDDDEGEEIQPTVTYYRNVLGNVNRLLDNRTPPPRQPKPRTRNTNMTPAVGSTSSQDAVTLANNNLMIQQNVYNSIFIPNGNRKNGTNTNGCAPNPLPRTFLPVDAQKPYQWNSNPGSNSDTTMYGMSSANLSFATRDYLERHGLTSIGGCSSGQQQQLPNGGRPPNQILDTPWQNQPKYL